MNRASIARGASAPHPFRQAVTLAEAPQGPPARHPLRLALAARRQERTARIWAALRRARPAGQDMRDFLLAYCACFVAAMAFIS